jgi:DNA-binding NarL/FixJ family response regulator
VEPHARSLRPPLRVVVVDDHAVVRAGLRAELATRGIDVVGEAADVAGAVATITDVHPDAVVLDVHIPGGGGPAVLAALGETAPPTLAMSASDQRDDVVATVGAGAGGYLLKTAPIDRIAAAVHAVHAGRPVFSSELAGHLLDLDVDLSEAIDDPDWRDLTDREREVLGHLARGHPYRRIAELLDVSTKTVETHVRHILQKLHLRTRHEAAVWAIDRGFDTD